MVPLFRSCRLKTAAAFAVWLLLIRFGNGVGAWTVPWLDGDTNNLLCACSPRAFGFTLNFTGTCPGNLVGGDAIEDTICFTAGSGHPVAVENLTISEAFSSDADSVTTSKVGPFQDGDAIFYKSIASFPNLTEAYLPRSLSVFLDVETATGESLLHGVVIKYTNDCHAWPVYPQSVSIGWISINVTVDASEQYCPLVAPSTSAPSLDPDSVLSSPPSSLPGASTSPSSHSSSLQSNSPSSHSSSLPTNSPSSHSSSLPTNSPSSLAPSSYPSNDPSSLPSSPPTEEQPFERAEALETFDDTLDALKSAYEELTAYVQGAGLDDVRRELSSEQRRELLAPLLVRAGLFIRRAFEFSGPAINWLVENYILKSEAQVLSEIRNLNTRMDEFETLVKEGFKSIKDEIKTNAANIELDENVDLLTGMEILLLNFGKPDLMPDVREKYKEQFRKSCNVPHFLPSDMFRYFYGHACSNCSAIGGGTKAASYFLDTYLDAAESALEFREGFSVIVMSALIRAMLLHTVCLTESDVPLYEDPVWMNQLQDMANGIEEVASHLQSAELFRIPKNRGIFSWVVYAESCSEYLAKVAVSCNGGGELVYREIDSFLDVPTPRCSLSKPSTLECVLDSADLPATEGTVVAVVIGVACRWDSEGDSEEESIELYGNKTQVNPNSGCKVLLDGASRGNEQVCLIPITNHAETNGYGGCFEVNSELKNLKVSPQTSAAMSTLHSSRQMVFVFVFLGFMILA